jgi:hypothetical protein
VGAGYSKEVAMRAKAYSRLINVICFFTLIGIGNASQPSSRGLLTGFDFLIEQTPTKFSSGSITIRIKAIADTVFDQFRLQFVKFDRIKYSGLMELTAPAKLGDTSLFEFDIYIPAKDTSGFTFRLYGGGGFVGNTGDVNKYWITTGTIAESWTSDPRAVRRYWNPPPTFDYSSSRMVDSLEAEIAKNKPYTTENRQMIDKSKISNNLLIGHDFTIEQIPSTFKSGSITLRVTATQDTSRTFSQFQLQMLSFDHLDYFKPTYLAAIGQKNKPASIDINITVPDNDTSGLTFLIFKGKDITGKKGTVSRFWITTRDSAVSYRYNPRGQNKDWKLPQEFIYFTDSLIKEMKSRTIEANGFITDSGFVISEKEWRKNWTIKHAIDSGWIPFDYDLTDPRVRHILEISE